MIKTTDRGTTWFTLPSNVSAALSCIHFRNENTGYISGSATILKTTNAGQSWVTLSAPYVNFENIRDISFTDDNNGIAVSDAGRVLKTTNAGVSWELITSGTGESLFGIYFTDANTAYACGNNGAIIRTTNGGLNWSNQTSPLTEILTDIWFTTATTGFISTWSGKILKTTNGGVTFISQTGTEIPENFQFEQNYPNPFNPVTKFRFSIPNTADVKLKIFDVSGREITTLLNKTMQPGKYEINWDASAYSSGVYFYKIETKDFTSSKKMLLIK